MLRLLQRPLLRNTSSCRPYSCCPFQLRRPETTDVGKTLPSNIHITKTRPYPTRFKIFDSQSSSSISPPDHRLRPDFHNTIRHPHIKVASFHSTCTKPLPSDPEGPKPKRRRVLPLISERENITNLPNILTVTRLVAAPVIGYLILHDQHLWAVSLLAYASLTDLVDGYVARRWNLQTVIGTVLDPLADKLLMTILTVCLAVKGALPLWIAALILGKDAGLGVAAVYYRWISLPPPKTFWRYWDFSLPSAEVKPTTISKYNTALQLLLLMVATAEPLVTMNISTAMVALQYTVGTTTVWSALSYVYTKDAVRILPQKQELEPKRHEGKKDKSA
ncbi:hypothetical protein TWF694_005960 [Orbilia ellipsospora]|uniref:Phosphatidyl synthase n=1 Tax=Orbilia ellipsospora TaxID=2528407 RepID=A0AAV9WTT1_9PEZI